MEGDCAGSQNYGVANMVLKTGCVRIVCGRVMNNYTLLI